MKKLTTEIFQQAGAKPEAQPAHEHRLLMFLVQHYCLKVPYLLQLAGATPQQLGQVLQHFDEKAGNYFTKVNKRPLSAKQSATQRAQQLEKLRPEPAPQVQQQCQSDITEEDDDDLNEDYDETRSTTRVSASGSNIAHIEKANSLKRNMTGETRGKQKKQGDIINNFNNVRIS
eukprot:5935926-Amphidinium_carterae.1